MLRYEAPTRPRYIRAKIAWRGRGEARRGAESYSAGLTAQPRRESCQFRSDPRVRVPETAGLAPVSTRPSGPRERELVSRPQSRGSSGIFGRILTLLRERRRSRAFPRRVGAIRERASRRSSR